MNSMIFLFLASVGFVGSHFVMSHPLRAPLVSRLGTNGFLVLYTLVSFVFLGLMVHTYRSVPVGPAYWAAGDIIWAVSTVIMLFASILFVGSNIKNPALPMPGADKMAMQPPHGVFRITRHPMMWSFALWGLVHILIAPRTDNFIFCGAIIVLALVGAHMQDRKKKRLMGDSWVQWTAATSFVPFARGFAMPGWVALIGGTALWLFATWLHMPLGAPPAGIWAWL